MILKRTLYKVPNGSIYVRVLNIYYTTDTYAKVKLRLEYKSGMIIETKSYKLILENIQHWEQVQLYVVF